MQKVGVKMHQRHGSLLSLLPALLLACPGQLSSSRLSLSFSCPSIPAQGLPVPPPITLHGLAVPGPPPPAPKWHFHPKSPPQRWLSCCPGCRERLCQEGHRPWGAQPPWLFQCHHTPGTAKVTTRVTAEAEPALPSLPLSLSQSDTECQPCYP